MPNFSPKDLQQTPELQKRKRKNLLCLKPVSLQELFIATGKPPQFHFSVFLTHKSSLLMVASPVP